MTQTEIVRRILAISREDDLWEDDLSEKLNSVDFIQVEIHVPSLGDFAWLDLALDILGLPHDDELGYFERAEDDDDGEEVGFCRDHWHDRYHDLVLEQNDIDAFIEEVQRDAEGFAAVRGEKP